MAKRSASKTVSPRLAVAVIGSLVALIVLVLVISTCIALSKPSQRHG